MAIAVSAALEDWPSVERDLPADNRGLLVGNGASMAIWPRFGYTSLYDIACDPLRPVHLDTPDKLIFDKMETRNFEAVLSGLITAGNIWKAFDKPNNDIDDLRDSYRRIRNSLVSAVRDVHVPYDKITATMKTDLRNIFARYEYLYSTNYDLLVYWCMMDDATRFKDFFWTRNPDENLVRFDVADTDLWNQACTKVLFLHGALHLYRDTIGTFKKVGGEQGTLLQQFDFGEALPLFISEGTYKDKQSAIARNNYLSFAYSRFSKHRGSLVVFGHSLTEAYDKHITDAINKWRRYDQKRFAGRTIRRVIAISMLPTMDPHIIIQEKTRLHRELGNYELRFFNSQTHPLGTGAFAVT